MGLKFAGLLETNTCILDPGGHGWIYFYNYLNIQIFPIYNGKTSDKINEFRDVFKALGL